MEIQLNLAADGSFALPTTVVVGARTAVLGASGSGKSNTAAVLLEELAPHMPVGVIDPKGEMWTLRERLDITVVGASEHTDIDIEPHQAYAMGYASAEFRTSMILDMFDYDDEEAEEAAIAFATGVLDACKKQRKPYHLFIEEADVCIPQPLPKKSIWKNIAKRGRAFGLGMVISTQRSQGVDKEVLTQCQNAILHSVTHPRDIGIYKEIVPAKSSDVEKAVRALHVGQAIVVYQKNGANVKPGVQMRRRETPDSGYTPQLGDDTPPPIKLKEMDERLLNRLKAIAESTEPAKPDPAIAERDQKIKDQAAHIAMLEGLTDDLNKQVAEWKRHSDLWKERAQTLGLITVRVEMVDGQPVVAAGNNHPLPASPPKSTPAPPAQVSLFSTAEGEGASQMVIARQQKRFDRLKAKVTQLSSRELRILSFLMANPGHSYALRELAAMLGYEETSLTGTPPLKLIQSGLISRAKTGREYRYQSAAQAYVRQHFAVLNTQAAMRELMDAAKPPEVA